MRDQNSKKPSFRAGCTIAGSLIMLAALVAGAPAVAASSGAVELTLSADKDAYTPTDPINVSLTLKNTGGAPLYVNKRFYMSSAEMPKDQRDVYFTVTSPSGEKLPCKYAYPTGFPKSDYFVLLEPGAEVSAEYKRNLRGFFDFKEPGTYTVTAHYENVFGAEIGLDVFRGPVESKPVSITIAAEQNAAAQKPPEKK